MFLSIGICHPAVIKMEYYLGKKSWWLWLVVGLLVAGASLFVPNQTVSTILGGFAFSCFWGILAMRVAERVSRLVPEDDTTIITLPAVLTPR